MKYNFDSIPDRRKTNSLKWDVAENEICFKTAEEFKGLESDVVIYLTHEFTDIPSSTIDKRKDYVAITRARYYLYILNTKCKAILGE